ncbi:MAG: NAD-dependent epimerase/dehydratase family protein [Magnetovibrio sp.]|nr:NAD-dependent epimerase/dehydratase family protein [Magnetovibrio sp.]
MRVALVTGCAGFLGRNMTKCLLADGWQVRGVDLPSANWSEVDHRVEGLEVDIADLSSDDSILKDVNAAFYFSGLADNRPALSRPLEYLDTNTRSFAQFLEAVRGSGLPKVLFASSSAVYAPHNRPMGEDAKCDPANPYGLSKMLSENIASHWRKVYGLPTVSLRIFQCYGPGAVFGGAVTGFFNRHQEGLPLTVVGDGSQVRDFIHVDDVCEGFLRVAEADQFADIYNLGTGQHTTILDLAQLIDPDNIEFLAPRDGDVPMMLADMSRFKADMGWLPEITLVDGVGHLLKT